MIQLRTHFDHAEDQRLREYHLRQRHAEQSRREDQKRREDASEEMDADILAAITAAVFATPQDIESFSIELEEFDARLGQFETATLTALMQKQKELEEIDQELETTQVELESMRKNAHTLNNGRKIFVSQDGGTAIDMDGNDVPMTGIDVDIVPPRARIAKQYLDRLEQEAGLVERKTTVETEINSIHEFDRTRQEYADRMDDISAEIKDGEVTKDQLDAYREEMRAAEKDLLQLMPTSIRKFVPGLKLDAEIPDMKPGFDKAVAPEIAQQAVTRTVTPDIQPGS